MRKYLAALFLALSLVPAFAQPPPVPALPDTPRIASYSLSASVCTCSVGFALYGDSTDYGNWLDVKLTTGSGATAVTTTLTAVTDYTITSATGALSTIARPITDGLLTLTVARTGTLQIVGAQRPRRLSQFTEGRGVAARDLNQAFTSALAIMRETWDRTNDITGRALLTNPGETIGPLPSAAARAGGLLGFNSSGDPIPLATLTGLGNVVGPNTSVVGHIATYGNTAGTILLDGGLIGLGNVTGPGSSAANHAPTFSDASGILLKDSGLTITPSTGTLTVTNGKTLAASNSLTLTGTDGSSAAFGTGGTIAYTANNLSVFAATTSAQLAGVLSDETGTGAAVFANSPALAGTPTAPTAAPGNNTTQLASTAFVTAAVTAATAGVASLDGYTGAITGADLNVLNAKAANYTVANTDCGSTIYVTGALNVITLPAVAGFDTKCAVRVKNGSSTRAQKITGFPTDLMVAPNTACGASNNCLWPLQSIEVKIVNGAWVGTVAPGRWRVSSPNFYADKANGSDNNDCLTTTTAACATIQHAIDLACHAVDSAGSVPTINVADGTAYAPFQLVEDCIGSNQISVVGNTGTPANVQVTDGGVATNIVYVKDKAIMTINGMKLTPTVSGSSGVACGQNSTLDVNNVVFNDTPSGSIVNALDNCQINLLTGISIVDNSAPSSASAFMNASQYGRIQLNTNPTFTGTWSFSFGCLTVGGLINIGSHSFSGGTVTGPRYLSELNGVIYNGAASCPGNSAGSVTLGGQAS